MVKTKIAIFAGEMQPIAHSLPSSMAASIGRTIVRYTYLESLMAKSVHALMSISIKQGRLAVRLPPSKSFPSLILALLQIHGLYPKQFNSKKLGVILDDADRSRNILAHSIILKHKTSGKYYIQVVRGNWELDDGEAYSVTRAVQPETILLDKAYLTLRRKEVDNGIKSAMLLWRFVSGTLRSLNEKRSTQDAWDRRSRRAHSTPPVPPQSSAG